MDYITLLEYALERQASDIHLVPGAVPVIRKNGKLEQVEAQAAVDYLEINSIVDAICNKDQLERLKSNGEVSFSHSIHNLGRFRINIIMQRGTASITFRLLRFDIPEVDTLGIPNAFIELINYQRGLLLVSGASGSGKSTTIAALINKINQTSRAHVITVEEPIEYLFKHHDAIISQRDVGTDCPTIYDGVLGAMKHDPDILMISDLSDERVIDLALQIAESGKLVIAGVPANNSRSTIEKIVTSNSHKKTEMRKYKLTATLLGIISQQLVPAIDESNQLLAYEFLLPNAAIKSYIINDQLKEITQALIAGRKHSMMYMDNSLFELYKAGQIKRSVVYKYAHDIEFVKRQEFTHEKA
ncbi:type IV pilus twitching motility protein PilT [Fusibacter ferrireducens]|uniref:Flp pilus assembly complex ATPase component TadA n=1 Tax=Fusibacter ferrireducens TaxID=2785058 RepID=A0ABR9ZUP7_9FIRM|nr:ATPase, T2SS/T4P/T4SS family [Fusibacter ferrireducens]MBF4693691.1 Flp pilus assembly complex ATPase component TadA [Fusibacter ferrireducens]